MKIKKILCMLLCTVLCFSIVGCSGGDQGPSSETIYYNLEKEPQSLDPQIVDDDSSRIAVMAIFEGLVRIGEDGEVIPGVATSWQANSSQDSFTFSLRQNAKWPAWKSGEVEQEASAVTAQDFVYGLQRALDPVTDSPAASDLYPIKNAEKVHKGQLPVTELGVRAINDYTLTIDLEYSYEEFPTLMALPCAMPCNRTFFESTGGQYGLEVTSVLGNGPYQFTNRYAWEHAQKISLIRSETYQGESKPIPAALSFSIGQDMTDAVGAILAGTVDAAPLPGDQVKAAQEAGFHLTAFEDTTWGLCFNVQNEILQNTKVRKGLLQVLDRDYVLSDLPENYTRAEDIVTPETTLAGENYRKLAGSGFCLPVDESARSTLEAGLRELQQDGLPSIRVICLDDPKVKNMVNNMLELWTKKLGYYFNMLPMSRSELERRVRNGDYQIALAPLRAQDDGPLEFLSKFSSDHPENPAGLNSAEYDGYLASASSAPVKEGLEYYVSAEKYLNEQAIFYPLCYEKRYFAASDKVTGIVFHSYDSGVDFSAAKKNSD